MDGPPIDDGAVAVAGDRIAAVGRFEEMRAPGGAVIDLGEMVLLPGLINAHCHLDFTSLRGEIAPQRSFADWILQINGLRRELSDEIFSHSIARGFAEARRWGTTDDREYRVNARAARREWGRRRCGPGGSLN